MLNGGLGFVFRLYMRRGFDFAGRGGGGGLMGCERKVMKVSCDIAILCKEKRRKLDNKVFFISTCRTIRQTSQKNADHRAL